MAVTAGLEAQAARLLMAVVVEPEDRTAQVMPAGQAPAAPKAQAVQATPAAAAAAALTRAPLVVMAQNGTSPMAPVAAGAVVLLAQGVVEASTAAAGLEAAVPPVAVPKAL
jgi:hypothetical protein